MTVTPFSNTHAVETWDAWFRWREHGRLRDVTVEDTWARVAAALAASLRTPQADFAQCLFGAMRDWKLLPDERVLASGGTSAPQWDARDLGAALNLAAFVRAPGLAHATLDVAALEHTATLATFALDGAVHAADDATAARCLRIGLLGVGDALRALGLDYDSDAACAQTAAAAAALASGCLSGALAIARDSGAALQPDAAWLERAARRGYSREVLDAAARHGVAYTALTAIAPQQRLACFANRASDALDPVFENLASAAACTFDSTRPKLRQTPTPGTRAAPALSSVAAQLRLRAAAQTWIDAPIAYPVVCTTAPDNATQDAWRAQALDLGLAPPSWRLATCESGANATPRQSASM